MDNQTIAAIGTAIVGPIIAYLKLRDERAKTSEKRDADTALINKRVTDLEKKVDSIDELKKSIEKINVTLAKIETILELYMKKVENK